MLHRRIDRALLGALLVIAFVGTGRPSAVCDAQASTSRLEACLGEDLAIRRSEHFCLFSTGPIAEASALLDLAEAVYDDFTFMFGEPAGLRVFGDRPADVYILSSAAEYDLFMVEIMPWYRRDEAALDFYLASERVINTYPPVSVIVRGSLPLKNWVVNSTAHFLLSNFVGPYKRIPPWLAEGFANYLERRETGSNRTYRVTIQAYGDSTEDVTAMKRGQAVDWPDIVGRLVDAGRHRRFSRLKHVSLNHLGFHDLCQSWSLVAYLAEEHPGRFVRWIRALRRRENPEKSGWESAFYGVFGWTNAELDARWEEWARLTGEVWRMNKKKKKKKKRRR